MEPMERNLDNRVLIVDDDPTSRRMISAVLNKFGYVPIVVGCGQDALSALRGDRAPHVALVDWMMPDMDGPHLCREMKRDSRTELVYVIMLTSRNEAVDVIQGLDSGADDFISKPPNAGILRSRIDVGFRMVRLQKNLAQAASEMETLAQKRAEQLAHAERMTTIGLLSAGIAHEINNPASFLAVNIRTIEDFWPAISEALSGDLPVEKAETARMLASEMPEILREMKSGVSRITEIVGGLKLFARTDDSKIIVGPITDSLNDALKLCRNRIRSGTLVRTDYAPEIPHIRFFGSQLQQVFLNLAINAIDAMESLGVAEKELFIGASFDGEMIRIVFRDTGPGIPERLLRTVFQPFFTTKPPGKGTGLGLFICRDIVEKMGGRITCTNRKGGGAEFMIVLPPHGSKEDEKEWRGHNDDET
jgi:signal transduction histidine kinase